MLFRSSNDFNVEITTNFRLTDDGATEEVKGKMLDALKTLEPTMGKVVVMGQRTVSASVSSELWNSSFISMTFLL